MEQFVLDVAGLSDRGVKRDHNEDAWSAPPSSLASKQLATKGRLYVVADGVGGHLAGDVASKMAVEIIQQRYYADAESDVAASLSDAIQAASEQIDQESAARAERRGMSTTVTAVVVRGNQLTVANVGDSRTYLIRKGDAQQVTSDHTWVEEQVQVGLITREEAAKHPQRNIITRSLGGNQRLDVDIFEEEVAPGDSVLLCSDGLSNMVPAEEIGEIVRRGLKAEDVVRELIDLAKARGAPDNVTAVLLNVVRQARGGLGRLLLTAGILGGFALMAGGVAFGVFAQDDNGEHPPATEPVRATGTTPASSQGTSPLATEVLAPLDLVSPTEDAALIAGTPITFVWDWETPMNDGQLLFRLQTGAGSIALVQEQLPPERRQYVLSQHLEPGRYLWTMTISRSEIEGPASGRLFEVLEPTPTANANDPN